MRLGAVNDFAPGAAQGRGNATAGAFLRLIHLKVRLLEVEYKRQCVALEEREMRCEEVEHVEVPRRPRLLAPSHSERAR